MGRYVSPLWVMAYALAAFSEPAQAQNASPRPGAKESKSESLHALQTAPDAPPAKVYDGDALAQKRFKDYFPDRPAAVRVEGMARRYFRGNPNGTLRQFRRKITPNRVPTHRPQKETLKDALRNEHRRIRSPQAAETSLRTAAAARTVEAALAAFPSPPQREVGERHPSPSTFDPYGPIRVSSQEVFSGPPRRRTPESTAPLSEEEKQAWLPADEETWGGDLERFKKSEPRRVLERDLRPVKSAPDPAARNFAILWTMGLVWLGGGLWVMSRRVPVAKPVNLRPSDLKKDV